MRNNQYSSTIDFISRFFGVMEHRVELRACPNVKGTAGAESLMTREAPEMRSFCQRKDVAGIGTYFGVATRKAGVTSGKLENIVSLPALWVDIDCVKQGLGGGDVIAALEYLPRPPSIIINSGGGLHAYWMLEDHLDVSEGQEDAHESATAALRSLAHVLAGDMSCAELARIMRLPGTQNSKPATLALYDGEAAICEVITDTGAVYDFDDLCEWLAEQRTVLKNNVVAIRKDGQEPVKKDNDPFVEYASEVGFKPSLDLDTELAAMVVGSGGDDSVHKTQIRVVYSMIARGYDDDDIVEKILAATEQVVPAGEKWNWKAEEKALRADIVKSRGKQEAAELKKSNSAARDAVKAGIPASASATVHSISAQREKKAEADDPPPKKRKRQPKEKGDDEIIALGSSALNVWKDRYGSIMFSRGTAYCYEAGVWQTWDERHDQILRIMMQEACDSLNISPKTGIINAAMLYFLNRPGLLVRDVDFDEHNLIIAGDGTINPGNGEVGEHSPDHMAMFKVGAFLEGSKDCHAFIEFLQESFADKPLDEIPLIIATLQEWFGACLVANKGRALSKGLLVHGGSRTGKTQLSEILRALLGKGQTSATSAGDIGGDFGLQPFLGKRGWVADDAIGQGEYLDAERYKKIVTGEELGVRRKNKTDVMTRFGFPVMLTANNLPKIKDQSDAVYNRSLVLPMTHTRPENKPEPAGYNSIAEKIVAEELTGVLWWAIEGWQRLHKRGMFDQPECMKKAVADLQDNNNSVGAWMKEAVALDPQNKVSNSDLYASFAGWYFQENGDGKFPWSQNGFIRRIKEAVPNLGYQKGMRGRNLTGLRLTEDGLEYWKENDRRDSVFAPKGNATEVSLVNQDFDPVKSVAISKAYEEGKFEHKKPLF